MLTEDRPFLQFVREERLFCSVLAHLLMQQGENLDRFLRLLNEKLPGAWHVPADGIAQAEIYPEFSYLRDDWFALGRSTAEKRGRILAYFGRIPSLATLQLAPLPDAIPDF